MKTRLFLQSTAIPLLCLVVFSASAQTYRPFKVNVSGGYALAKSADQSNGFVWAVEPRYGFSDHFELGAKLETAYLTRIFRIDENLAGSRFSGATSYGLTANYFPGKTAAGSPNSINALRPYFGVGIGNYRVGSATVELTPAGYTSRIGPVSRLGFMVRAGVKVNHFNVAVEYNLVDSSSSGRITGRGQVGNSYLSFKAGFDIGGGLQ